MLAEKNPRLSLNNPTFRGGTERVELSKQSEKEFQRNSRKTGGVCVNYN